MTPVMSMCVAAVGLRSVCLNSYLRLLDAATGANVCRVMSRVHIS